MSKHSNSPPTIYKANDIRGIYGETLTDSHARKIGGALAATCKQHGNTIAIGRDGRLSSPALSAALIEGLTNNGVQVLDIGLVPTPALYYTAWQYANGNGVMITGSHNPPSHNGMKMLINGKTISGKEIGQQVQHLTDATNTQRGAISTPSIMEEYIDAICKHHMPTRPLHLVIDAGNGSAGEFATALYQKLGHKITPLFCDADGHFPNHHPDPAQPENLRHARDCMHTNNADAAFIFDGDGDRLGVILPSAEDWVFPDRLLMLLARDLLQHHAKARVVFDVKCTAHLSPWITKHGGIADMQPTGHAFIKARMAASGALLGGEMSGHFYFAENWAGFDDALLAGAKFAAIFAKDANAMNDIPKSVASPEIVVPLDKNGKSGHQLIEQLRGHAVFNKAKDIVDIDGLRAEYDDGFGLVRASNTTASLVLRFEGDNATTLARIKNDFAQVLAEVGLTLPNKAE